MSSAQTAGLRREILPNGVTLLVQRRRAAPAATLATLVRAGFLDEPDELVGISHVLEHMLFKGTPTVAPGELAQLTKALGGSLNAYTSYDRTVYFASVPARHAVALMALQADQVRNPLIDSDELRRELGVIIQEANRKLDSPGAVAGETLHELLYDVHRIRRWRIGVEAMLTRFTRDDVAGYHASRYAPHRTIVSFVGDVDEDVALDALRAQWSDWGRPIVEIPAGPVESGAATMRARRMSGDVALGEVVLGWRAPGILHDDIPALELAAAILGVGRASRFGSQLRETGVVNAVGVSSYGVIDAGVFSVGLELDPARIGDALAIVAGNIRDLADHELDRPDFDRAVAMLRSRIARGLEPYESRAIALAAAESLGDVIRLDREEADLLAVTPAKVREVVNRYLSAGAVSGVGYLPKESGAAFDEVVLRDGFNRKSAGGHSPVRMVRPAGASVMVGRTANGPSSSQFGVNYLALPGIDILTARFGQTGQTTLGIYRARRILDTSATAGLAALTVRAMVRGTLRHNPAELAFALESLGGGLSPSLGADVLGFGTTVLSEHVSTAAMLLAEVIYQPRLADGTVEVERSLLIEDARAVADDMVRFPVQLALGTAFNDVGYGSPSLGTPDSLATFDADSVRRWHREMLTGGRTTIIAVGDADPEWLADAIATVVSSPVVPSTSSGPALSAAKDERVAERLILNGERQSYQTRSSFAALRMTAGTRVEHRDRKQSALAMLFPGPSRHDPERFAAETWGAIAAGLGGRLFESLRSKRSLAYTVIANSWQRSHAGGLLTYIATEPARLDEARAAMFEELDFFRREPPSEAEMSRATAMLAGHAEMSRQTAGGFAGEIADAWLLGEGLAELDDPAAPYRSVTADAVHAVTARSLDPSLRAEGVVAATPIE